MGKMTKSEAVDFLASTMFTVQQVGQCATPHAVRYAGQPERFIILEIADSNISSGDHGAVDVAGKSFETREKANRWLAFHIRNKYPRDISALISQSKGA